MLATFLLIIVQMVFLGGQTCCGVARIEHSLDRKNPAPLLNSNMRISPAVTTDTQVPVVLSLPRNSDSTALQSLEYEIEKAGKTIESEASSRGKKAGLSERAVTRETSFKSFPDRTRGEQRKKALLQCLLLEMSILFHSIFIGIAISVAVGKEFVVLLVAIGFHRILPTLLHHERYRTDF